MFLQLQHVAARGAARFAQHPLALFLLVGASHVAQKGFLLLVVGGTMFALVPFIAEMHERKVFVQVQISVEAFTANVTPMHQSRYDSLVFG